MSKSKNSQRDVQNSPLTPSLDSLLAYKIRPTPVLLPVPNYSQQSAVLQSGDRRLFQPDRSTAPPHAAVRSAARVTAGASNLASLKFADPKLVALCVRRKVRKEVLFAIKKTRKGSGASRRKNFWSNISCKG